MKRLRCICDNPWAFFDLSSVAAGSQSAMQQYYLPTIYIIWRWTGISLAIIRSVSLRPQNEGQKNSRIITDLSRSLWHGFFWPLFFSMHRDYKRICKRDRLRLLRKWRMKNEEWRMKNEEWRMRVKKKKNFFLFFTLTPSLSARNALFIGVSVVRVSVRVNPLPSHSHTYPHTKIRLKSHLSCQGTIKIKRKSKIKSKNESVQRLRDKSVIIRERFLI